MQDSEQSRRESAATQADHLQQQIATHTSVKRKKLEEAKLADIADRERVEREMAELARRHAEEDARANAAKQAKIQTAQRIADATEAARQVAIEQREAHLHRHHAKAQKSAAISEHHHAFDDKPTERERTPPRTHHADPAVGGEHADRSGGGMTRRTPVLPRPPRTPLETRPTSRPHPPAGKPPPSRSQRRGSRLPRPSRIAAGDDEPRHSQSRHGAALDTTQASLADTQHVLSELLASAHMNARSAVETNEEKVARADQAYARDEALVQIGKIKALLQAQSRETEVALHTDLSRFRYTAQHT